MTKDNNDPLRIQCWSGPRNISTAFMYAWAQRADTTVYDEPIYAQYLARFDRGHPMTSEVLASQSHNIDEVINNIILGPCATPVLFIKQMAHHLRDTRTDFLAHTKNLLLVRDPLDMLRSLSQHMPQCTIDDTGLVEQVELLDAMVAQGQTPTVIDSQWVLRDPENALATLCSRLGIAFDPAMLTWPPGPKPYDGVWADVWYQRVHSSTGFTAHQPNINPLPDINPLPPHLEPVLKAAQPLYNRLMQHALQTPPPR